MRASNEVVANSASELLTQEELSEMTTPTRRARLPVLRMSRPEKGILLGMFLEHDFPNKSRSEREQLTSQITEAMLTKENVRQKIKDKLIERHVLNYWSDFSKPLTENEGKAMPYCRNEDGTTVRGGDGNPLLDEEKIDAQEDSAPGTEAYWNNLIKLHEICSSATSTSTDNSETQVAKMRAEREKRSEIAKRQRDAYAAQKDDVKRRRAMKERQAHASDLFKVQALRSSLVTSQQNAAAFHSFTTAFCAMANQPPPQPLNLPSIPDIPSDCLTLPPPLTETQSMTDRATSQQDDNADEGNDADEHGVESDDGEDASST